ADDRMADGAEMHADLVHTAGGNGDVQERDAMQVLGLRDSRHRAAGPSRPGRHLLAIAGIAPDRRVDAPSLLHESPDERDVFLLDFAILELPGELVMRRVVFCSDHDAGGAPIQSVHDPGSEFAADTAEIVHVVQQRVDDRAAAVTRPGVHHHAGGLVDHHDVGVLVKDRQREIFGDSSRFQGRGEFDLECLSGLDGRARADDADRTDDVPVFDELLNLRARSVRQRARQEGIEPYAVLIGGYVDPQSRRSLFRRRTHAATRCAAAWPVGSGRRRSNTSIAIASGTTMSDTNWDVETAPNTIPRLSPR